MNTTAREKQLGLWLTKVLGVGHNVRPLAGDASFRRYFRVWAPNAPGPKVVMDAPPQLEPLGPFLQIADRLRHAGVRVPDVEAVDRDAGFLLLSDLGDRLLLALLHEGNADALYHRAIDQLIAMQRQVDASGLPDYDGRRLRNELMLFPQWFLERHLRRPTSTTEANDLEQAFECLEQAALEQPVSFVHRDYHSRNLLDVNGVIGVLDFQDAVQGPVTYDLVSLLRDVYIEWPLETVERWVDYYHERAVAQGLLDSDDRREFGRWFDLMGIQRHLKIAGIFSRLYYRDGKSGYLSDLPLTLRYLRAIVPRFPELAALERLLNEISDAGSDAALVRGGEMPPHVPPDVSAP